MEVLIESQVNELNQPSGSEIDYRTSVVIALRLVILTMELEKNTIMTVAVVWIFAVNRHYMLKMLLGSSRLKRQSSCCHSNYHIYRSHYPRNTFCLRRTSRSDGTSTARGVTAFFTASAAAAPAA